MSQTTDFINNQIVLLQSKIKEYTNDITNANTQVAAWTAMICDWECQISAFNDELQKVQISNAQLDVAIQTSVQSGAINEQSTPTV